MAKQERFVVYFLLAVALLASTLNQGGLLVLGWPRSLIYSLLLAVLCVEFFGTKRSVEASDGIVDEIRARRISLVGKDGMAQVLLGTDHYGGGVVIVCDNGGAVRTALLGAEDGGKIEMYYGSDIKAGVVLRAGLECNGIRVYDDDGTGGIGLLTVEKANMLQLLDSRGNPRMNFAITDEASIVGVHNAEGRPGAFLSIAEEQTSFSVHSPEGMPGVLLRVDEGESNITMLNARGSEKARLSTSEAGGKLSLSGRDGDRSRVFDHTSE